MITISADNCNGCGLCARVCHESCIEVSGKSVKIDENLCSTCGQCIAVCPSQTFGWDGIAPVPFDDARLPPSEQVAELLGERRTVRQFRPEKIDRCLLEEILGYAALAPTHNFAFRIVAVDDEVLRKAIEASILRFSRRIYYWVFRNSVVGWLARLSGPAMRNEFVKARPKLEDSLKSGWKIESPSPAISLIIGDKRVPLSRESAQYALHNINLYAMTKGLACQNLVGSQMSLNRDKALRRKLGLRRGEKIFGIMGVGRPSVRFRNKVSGKRLPLAWNGS